MDNIENERSSPPNPHDLGQNYESSQPPKLSMISSSNPQHNNFVDNGDDVYDTEDTEDDDNNMAKGIVIVGDLDDGDESDDSDDNNGNLPNGYNSRMIQDAILDREEQKKRKLKTLLSKYEFAPRAVVTKRSRGGRNSLTDWTEHESFVLLEAWGERYSRHGKKSVRSEEWLEVADKVSEGSKFKRTETQCRNRLDTLKKKYKKEKAMLAENVGFSSNWVYFSKMDMILCPALNQTNGNGSVNSKIHQNFENSSDEIKGYLVGDSDFVKKESENLDDLPPPKMNLVGDKNFAKNESYDVDDIPPKKARMGKERGGEDPFKMLADSIDKFGDMYEKIESYKSKQLVELEKMRMDFQRDLEEEKRRILKKGQVEIAKIWGVDIDDNDLSPGNVSG